MATIYSYTIERLYTKDITVDGTTYSDVIKKVDGYWTASRSGESAVHGFELDLRHPSSWSDFKSYDSLTQSNVVAMIETRIGADMMAAIKLEQENRLNFQLEWQGAKLKGTEETPTFPWS